MMKQFCLTLALAIFGLILMYPTGCRQETMQQEENYRFLLIMFGSAGNPFWPKVISGARNAADAHGFRVDIQYADNNPIKQNNIMETAIANKVDGIGIGPKNRNIFSLERSSQFQGCLTAKLYDHALQRTVLPFRQQNFKHIFFTQRLKIKPVGRIIIR